MSSPTPTTQSRNIAARMGRWSAAHWKTATFGWLAFVVVAFGLGGMVGTKTIDPNTPGPGESGRMDRILDAGFKQPASESVLIQSALARGPTDPAFTCRDRRRRRGHLEIDDRPERPLAARGGRTPARSPRTGTRPSSSSRSAATLTTRSRQDRPGPRPGRRAAQAPTRSSSSASSATPARSTRVDTRFADDLGRPASSRSRSRWSSSSSRSGRSWPRASRCCSA